MSILATMFVRKNYFIPNALSNWLKAFRCFWFIVETLWHKNFDYKMYIATA